MTKDRPYPGTQAVLRAISLLKAFTDIRPEWGLTELAQEVGLNKSTTFRLLTALASEGLISRSPNTETYRLGPEIIALGGRALRANDLRTVSRPELKMLAAEVGETASLEILTGSDVLILDEVAGEHVMSGGQAIGTRWPAFATSTGKAIMACLPTKDLESALPDPLFPVTPKTIIELDHLQQDLAQTQERGYAVASEELELGLVAVASPLLDYDGRVVGSIGLAGPTWRLAGRIQEIGEKVKLAAKRVSVQLGFQPDS